MLLTKAQLQNVYREAPASRIQLFIDPINEVLEKYQIDTALRCQMFLAQIGHESGQLRYTEELASGVANEAIVTGKQIGRAHV